MLMIAVRSWLLMVVAVLALLGCGESTHKEKTMASAAQISAAEWQVLTQKRVVFGHQSVGQNILDGVQSLAAQANVNLPIIKSRTPVTSSGIVHFFVGQNEDPSSKLKDYTSTLESGLAQGADIALVKFCYLDFKVDTDAKQIEAQYSETLDRLSQQFPNTTFVAVTAPLTIAQTGPKAWVKRLLGRTPSGFGDNARRQEFNELLRTRYGQQRRLFDLAKIEAEGADIYTYQGRPIEVLNPALTYDDGHLDSEAAQIVAAHLIKFLATLPVRRG